MLQSEEIPAAAYHVIWMEDAMCDIYEDLLAEKEREIEQMEFQIVECQREIRRLRNVCRCYEEEREIKQDWELLSLEDILKRLGAAVPFEMGQETEVLLTEDGKKAYADLKKILYAVERISGVEMKISKIVVLLDVMTAKNEEEAEICQLCLLLQIFDERGWKGTYSVGNWTITNGGYDLWFEIYYNSILKVECVDGKVTVVNGKEINQEAVLNCILEEYDNVRTGEED